MTAKSHPSLRSLAVVLVVGVALAGAGCGRKGDPLPPSQKGGTSSSPLGLPIGAPDPSAPAAKPAPAPAPAPAAEPASPPMKFPLGFLL